MRSLLFALLLLCSSCSATTYVVNVTADAFVPQELQILDGDIVVWKWETITWSVASEPPFSRADNLQPQHNRYRLLRLSSHLR